MNAAIIVAAGQGTRMGPGIDKIFLEVAGQPVIAHTWRRFEQAPGIDEIVLVVRAGLEDSFHELARRFSFRKKYSLVAGGRERQDSVWNGLQALPPSTEIVAIQDGARPCTRVSIIEATLAAAHAHGAAVAAQPVSDTIKESTDGAVVSGHPDRRKLWAVQTPQTFRLAIIRQALQSVRDKGLAITDDAAACELIGQSVRLVRAPHPNPKVTVAADLPYIALLLAEPSDS